jgi:hypothetical protein
MAGCAQARLLEAHMSKTRTNIRNGMPAADLGPDGGRKPWSNPNVRAGAMSQELSAWLRQQRQAHGWPVPEMARQLRLAAKDAGDTGVPGNEALCRNIRRWEGGHGGVSERYKLHYCKALDLLPGQFGPSRPREAPDDLATTSAAPSPPVLRARTLTPYRTAGRDGLDRPAAADVAYRWIQEPDLGGSWLEREVLMTAHEGSDHAERAERRDIGEATLEQLRADVTRLSHDYMTGEPFPLFLEMRRVRGRMYAALDRRLWPRDQAELYFLLGCLNGLMAVAANNLGSPDAADELARAGSAYAAAIDHRPLMARLRLELANVAHWSNQPRQSRDLAQSGLEYLPDGPNGAQLHLMQGRSAARLGDFATARSAINAARDAREREYHDDLLAMGGEFGFSRASQHYYTGSIIVEIPEDETAAIAELERAIELYAAGPEPGEDQSDHCKMAAHIDLATARLRAGQLDAATVAAQPVLSLSPSMRIASLPQRFDRARAELARPRYQGSSEARDLDEQIEEFCRETIAGDLHSLPAGPG